MKTKEEQLCACILCHKPVVRTNWGVHQHVSLHRKREKWSNEQAHAFRKDLEISLGMSPTEYKERTDA